MKPDFLLWLSGYNRELAEEVGLSRLDKARMRLVGAGVIISAGCALYSGSKAAEWITVGQPDSTRALVSWLAGVALATLIVYLDRVLIVATDQRSRYSSVGWLRAVRTVMIITFATSTMLKLLPSIIGPDLARWSYDDRDRRDATRATALAGRYDLGTKRQSVAADQALLVAAQRNLATIPADIARDLDRAAQCTTAVAKRRQALRTEGIPVRSVLAMTQAQSAGCTADRRQANDRLAAYRAAARAEVDKRGRAADQSEADVRDAATAVEAGLKDGRAIDAVAISPESLGVLTAHILDSPFIVVEVLGVLVIIMLFDSAGLLSKAAIGRTDAGRRLGDQRAAEEREDRLAFEDAEFEARDWHGARQAQSAALAAALGDPETQTALRAHYAALAEVIAPLAAAAAAGREVHRHTRQVEKTIRMTPHAATLLAQLLAEALAAASRNLGEGRA